VATVVYLLIVLRSTYGGTNKVPNLAVTGGTALVLLCLVALLVFVHHLARSIVVDTIIDRVGEALDADVERLLPAADFEAHAEPSTRPREGGAPLVLHHSGYVQAINHHGMVEIAKEADAMIELSLKPGRHVIEGGVLAWIAPPDAATSEVRTKLEKCLVLGGERASIQDLETSIRQLGEVALRALAPSINDPFSAMAVVDRLTESLRKIMQRGTSQCVWTDDDGTIRLLAPGSTFADTVEEAFRQVRQHSQNQPAVLIRLVEGLGQLLAQANATQRRVLQKEIEIILETGRRHIAQKEDLKVLEERSTLALAKSARSVRVG